MDPLILQRLMDGELSHDERASVLSALDAQPKLWRSLALSLIEETEFQRIISRMPSDGFPRAVSSIQPDISASSETAIHPSPTVSARSALQGSNWKWCRANWVGLAASLLLVVTGMWIGHSMEGWTASKTERSPSIEQDIAHETPTSTESYGRQDLIEAGRFRLVSDSSQPSVDSPIYEVDHIEPSMLLGNDLEQLNQLNRELRRNGWTMGIETQVFSANLPDGREMIVPVRNVNFQPFGL